MPESTDTIGRPQVQEAGKEQPLHVEDHHHTLKVKKVVGSEALAEAKLKEPPPKWSRRMFQLYGICLVAFLCSTINGFDGSLMGSMLVMVPYEKEFGAGIVGVKAAYISGMYTIGGVCALPFVGPCLDTWGRRAGMFIGCTFVILGTIVEGTTGGSGNLGQFLGGRFLLGFGNSIAASAAPAFVVEIAHPVYRGVITGLYNCFYYVGSITAAGAVRGTVIYSDNRSWLIPTWTQMVCSSIVCLTVMFLPESPRWLYTNGKQEKAKEIMVKYHGQDNPNSVYVELQMREFGAELELNGADKRFWDYRALVNSKAAIYRVMCNSLLAIFGQWAGNGVVSYYLPALLSTAGVTDPVQVLNINLGISLVSAAAAITGASQVERLGRRMMIFWTCVGCSMIWVAVTVGTALYAEKGSPSAATASIVFVFFFSIVYSFGFTPMQALYPVEVLSFEQRAKGMAWSSVCVNAASLLNQFAWPVALGAIGWRVYLIFVIWDLIQATVTYFFLVETKGRTLEELNEIFAAKNPRKASTRKKVIAVDENANIQEVKDA